MSTGSLGSAKRAIQIFEFFAEIRRPASVTDVWRGLDHPQSSTSKLLKMLAGMGYLNYDGETRRYVPTLRTALLGSWLHDHWFGHQSLLGVVERLWRELGTSVILAIQNDKYALYMLALKGTMPGFHHPRPDIPIGVLRPICRVAAGKALLLDWDDTAIGRLVRRINSEETEPEQHVDLPALLEEIRLGRETGFIFNKGSYLANVGVLATRLAPIAGQPRISISLSAPINWFDEHLDEAKRVLMATLAEGLHADQPPPWQD